MFNVFTEDEDGNFAIVRISDWWKNVANAIGGLFQSIFSVFTEDEDGKSTIERLGEWWSKVWEEIKGLFCSVFQVDLPSVEEVKNAISAWWADVVNSIKLRIGISVDTPAKATKSKRRSNENAGITEPFFYHADGAVFSRPTLFETGMGNHVVGEAGPEAVAPIGVLQGYVAQAVAAQNAEIARALDRLAAAFEAMDANMGDHMREALDDTALKVNNREFARMVKAVG